MPYYLLFNLLLVVAGCFLPWIHSALFVIHLRGVDMMDGKVMLILALAAAFFLLYQLLRKQQCLFGFYALFGLTVVAITGLDLYLFYKNSYPIGPGIYLSFLGGVQLAGCSLFCKVSGRHAMPLPTKETDHV